MIFKVGFTHDPAWRWANSLYGYRKSRDRWNSMLVVYLSPEPYSACMMEATLIEKYGCDLVNV